MFYHDILAETFWRPLTVWWWNVNGFVLGECMYVKQAIGAKFEGRLKVCMRPLSYLVQNFIDWSAAHGNVFSKVIVSWVLQVKEVVVAEMPPLVRKRWRFATVRQVCSWLVFDNLFPLDWMPISFGNGLGLAMRRSLQDDFNDTPVSECDTCEWVSLFLAKVYLNPR